MFSEIQDYSDEELNIYGLTKDTLRDSIEFWGYNWNEKMNSFLHF